MLETLQIRTFLSIVQAGSFSRAAAELNCVQSNVTARIRRLEQHLGAPLFERGRNGARLTGTGERLRRHAEDIMARIAAAEADLRDAVGEAAPLRLGSMESTAATRLPALMSRLQARFPDAELSLRTGTTDAMLNAVLDREIEAAFVAGPVDPDRFASVTAFAETLVAARPAERTVAGPLIAFAQGCAYRSRGEAWMRSTGQTPLRIVEMGSLDGILGCVAAGMGLAVVPGLAAASSPHRARLAVEPLPDEWGRSETLLAWRHDLAMTIAMRELAGWLADGTGDGSPEKV